MEETTEEIVQKLTRFLEDRKGLSLDQCLVVSKSLFDIYFDETIESEEGDDVEDEVDEFDELEEEDSVVEDVKGVIEEPERKKPVPGDHDYEPPRKKHVLPLKQNIVKIKPTTIPVNTQGVQQEISQEEIDDGDF